MRKSNNRLKQKTKYKKMTIRRTASEKITAGSRRLKF